MSVCSCLSKGGGEDSLALTDGDRDRADVSAAVKSPIRSAGIVVRIMLQQGPQIGLLADALGHRGQVIGKVRAGLALFYRYAALRSIDGQSACSFGRIRQKIVVAVG